MKCCFCGPIKNCAPYLNTIFNNIEKLGSIFDDYKIVVFYDDSTDNTLTKLIEYKKKNPRFDFYINKEDLSPFRTHRIAKARNYCLNQIREKYSDFPFFVMMDFDNVNCKNNVNSDILKKYVNRDDWDGLSFNTEGGYYDIWALSIRPFYFSYNHFKNNYMFHNIIRDYINKRINTVPKDELLECMSSFNGFSIYRTQKFLDCYYDGRIRTDLIPRAFLQEHMMAAKSPIIYKYHGLSGSKYETIDGRKEDCEHRSFHYMAIKSGGKIRISPEILFY